MSTTSLACFRCGRFDFPHVCLPWIGLEPIVAEREQGSVRFDVTIALTFEERDEEEQR